jgi:hypothetical protein
MKTFKLIVITTIVLVVSINHMQAQPRLTLNAYGGFIIPLPDLGVNPQSIPDSTYYLEKNYGMKFGFNLFTGEIEYAFDKKGHVKGVLGISFSGFLNPEGIIFLGLFGRPVRESMGIISLYLGPKYAFLPEESLSPFIGGNFTINFISGDDFDTETRYGMQFNTGAHVAITRSFGFVGGFKYDISNLIGKETNVAKFTGTASKLPLNDEEYTFHGKNVEAKSISFIQFYLGFSLFFGQPKKPKEIVF